MQLTVDSKSSFYKYRVTFFSQFIPAKVKKILRKSQPQFREKLRKLRLRKKCFSYKKHVFEQKLYLIVIL